WAGAHLDDVMNYLPARITWLLTMLWATLLPGLSARKAWTVTLQQHAWSPGPNSGWSETAFAAALQLRLAGPIWKKGVLVSDLWLGAKGDRCEVTPQDIDRAARLSVLCSVLFAGLGWTVEQVARPYFC
ncbi:MAG TPA: cobalamin biosynthesis protein, partial [Fibrobacteraceae bacterium]|nr:cobalamin biosynthesis protein [Fibrobacteraceae bacterium]